MHLPIHRSVCPSARAGVQLSMLLCSLVNAAGWTTRKKSIEFSVVFSHCASFLGQILRFREKCLSMFRNEKNFNQLQNSVPKQEGTCKLGLSFSCLWISDVLLQPNTGERSVKKNPCKRAWLFWTFPQGDEAAGAAGPSTAVLGAGLSPSSAGCCPGQARPAR